MRQTKILTFTTLILFTIFVLSESISACTCTEHGVPICAEYGRADAVFIGKIRQITPFNESEDVVFPPVNSISYHGKSGLVWLHIKVEKAFKGIQEKFIKVATYQGTSCDLRVKKSQRRIFYAYRNEKSGILGIGYCSGNELVKESLAENPNYVSELENLSQGKTQTFIKGRVIHHTMETPLEGIEVKIEGYGITAITQTDKDGKFSFPVNNEGIYKVIITLPNKDLVESFSLGITNQNLAVEKNLAVFSYQTEVKKNSCVYSEIKAIQFQRSVLTNKTPWLTFNSIPLFSILEKDQI